MKPDTWLGVEVRHLAALEAVATEGSFGRAAQKLGYTQSAISQQIAMLERLVGEQLIERPGGPRAVSMTEAGTVLLRHAASILARLQAAQADLAALSAGEAGSLRVGTIQSVGTKILPEVMRRFTGGWPKVQVELHESHSDLELSELVERGELDLAFVQLPLDNPSLETIELLRDEYVIVTATDSPFGQGKRPPTLREIAEQPLIGFRHCRATTILIDQLRSTGHEPRFVFRSEDNGVVQGLAGAGIGIALMPRLTVDANNDAVRVVELGTEIAPRAVGITWHADRYHSSAARAFVDNARAVTGDVAVRLAA
jgi:DNA-binding transcriptional LysR family regulator